MNKTKQFMEKNLIAAQMHLDDDNFINIGINPCIMCSEVSMTVLMQAERSEDFIRDYQVTVMIAQSLFKGDAEALEGEVVTYKEKERRILKVSATPVNMEWRFDLGAKYSSAGK